MVEIVDGEEITRKNLKLYRFQKNVRRNQRPFIQIPAFLKGMFRERAHCSCVPENSPREICPNCPSQTTRGNNGRETTPRKEGVGERTGEEGLGSRQELQAQESASLESPQLGPWKKHSKGPDRTNHK